MTGHGGVNTFSLEGRLFRVEYAMEAIKVLLEEETLYIAVDSHSFAGCWNNQKPCGEFHHQISLYPDLGGLGHIARILTLEVEDENAPLDAVQCVGSELAMHVGAAKPLFLTKGSSE